MNRSDMLHRVQEQTGSGDSWDIVVIGGGATGLGVAVDAAARGYRVALFESSDFGKGTSSRSTKLIHGGVRYLQQGNVPLVMEALRERGILRTNAPHLVWDLPFVVPNYQWWEAPFYGIGMRVYDVLAGRYGFGRSQNLSVAETIDRLPTIETGGLRGGVVYHDGQFDDARLLVHMAMTAWEQGAVILNYCPVVNVTKSGDGFVDGVIVRDVESNQEIRVRSRVVINATGAWTDSVRDLDQKGASPVIRPSQGVHIVLDRSFLPGSSAIMVPKTDDDRVLFAIPWHDRVLVGTTDTPVDTVVSEPRPRDEEVAFLLRHAARYLARDPSADDVLSVFAGIRPLVSDVDDADTAGVSREHAIRISDSGLISIAGGKWTTYRKMAKDAVSAAQALGDLEDAGCPTRHLRLHGYHANADRFGRLSVFGADAPEIEKLMRSRPGMGEPIHPRLDLTPAEIVWGCREEMARTLDDMLARRSRSLILDARAAIEAAPRVAAVMADELGFDGTWVTSQVSAFVAIARGYVWPPEA